MGFRASLDFAKDLSADTVSCQAEPYGCNQSEVRVVDVFMGPLAPDIFIRGVTVENTRYHPLNGQCPSNTVDSMGQRNTGPKSNLKLFQWLNSFESVDSENTALFEFN